MQEFGITERDIEERSEFHTINHLNKNKQIA